MLRFCWGRSILRSCLINIGVKDKQIYLHNFYIFHEGTIKLQKLSYSVQWDTKKSPFIMKLESQEFKCIMTDGILYLRDLFEKNGFELRVAGGAVRDLLLGNVPSDIDFATTATPDEMNDIFKQNNIRLINPHGESHGTVTPRIFNVNYEITTLRVDEETDGRHAVVKFTTDWYKDASRRDLTINSMYLDFDGNVYDYFNGVEDLKNRRVLFVGNADSRIKEDYLRIMRYFRFYGKIADEPDNHDEELLLAIKNNVDGLLRVSGERIYSELVKITCGNFNLELLKKIISLGIGPKIGLPECCNIGELERVVTDIRRNNFVVEPATILAALLRDEEEINNFVQRIKPSSFHRELMIYIVREKSKEKPAEPLKYFQLSEIDSLNPKVKKLIIIQYLMYIGDVKTLEEYKSWDSCAFPLKAKTILENTGLDQKKCGYVLKELKVRWINSDLKMTPQELQNQIKNILYAYDSIKKTGFKNKKRKGEKFL